MVLYLNRQASHPRLGRHPLGYRPALEYTFHLQTKVIMKMTRLVLMDNETAYSSASLLTLRLRGFTEITFPSIFFETHISPIFSPATTYRLPSKLYIQPQ